MKWHFAIYVLVLGFAGSLLGQESGDGSNADSDRLRDLEKRVERLETELAEARQKSDAANEAAKRRIRLYGDIGLRYQAVETDGRFTNNIEGGNRVNRPEYRIRFGAAGYILDFYEGSLLKHATKYEVRLSTVGVGDYPAPLGEPAEGWRPIDAFGSSNDVQFDRALIQHDYKQWLRVGGGRFGTPLLGSQLLFDNDTPMSGGYARLDAGFLLGFYDRFGLDDWVTLEDQDYSLARLWLQGAGYYLAQNNLGLPDPDAESQPWGYSLQLATRLRIIGTETVWTNAFGWHAFDGERAIAGNVGTGSTATTTNTVDSNGDVDAEFRIVEWYSELILLEQHISSLKFSAHVLYNLSSDSNLRDDYNLGASFGVSWGALQIDEGTRPFRLSYGYHYIEPNAAIPEFNHDVLNTNYKGHSLSVHISFARGLIMSAAMYQGRRVDESVGGVGRRVDGTPGSPSGDSETRYRVSVVLRF